MTTFDALRPEVRAELEAFRAHLASHHAESRGDCRFCIERAAKPRPRVPTLGDLERAIQLHGVLAFQCGRLAGVGDYDSPEAVRLDAQLAEATRRIDQCLATLRAPLAPEQSAPRSPETPDGRPSR